MTGDFAMTKTACDCATTTSVMPTYARLPVGFVRGQGNHVTDTLGQTYLDALSGIAVSTLGHAHPDLVAALADQAGQLLHTSNLYEIPLQTELAGRLAALSGLQEVFFCNSGCEANECAIKLARFYGHQRGIEHPEIIVMENAFHGRTLATLSATGNRKAQAGFEPLVSGFLRVPYDDFGAIERIAEHNGNVVAVLIEVIQGEGGIRLARESYLRQLRELCTAKGWLLMCDEVQCGVGRTGTWFGFQHANITPDVVTLAKGLGSGVPVGACLAGGAAANLFKPGNHGSTFGGNPLAMRAALTTLAVIERDGLMANAVHQGEQIRQRLAHALAGTSGVQAIRGRGLMIGIELDRPCGDLVKRALAEGLLINVTADKVVRLLPALVFDEAAVSELVAKLVSLIQTFLQE